MSAFPLYNGPNNLVTRDKCILHPELPVSVHPRHDAACAGNTIICNILVCSGCVSISRYRIIDYTIPL